MKANLALKVLLAISISFGTTTLAQTLDVSPNPVCVGDTVTVSLSGVCEESEAYATVNGNAVSLTNNGYGNWSGTYSNTPSDAGTVSCSAYDDCDDAFNTVSLTVVELNDITFVSQPSGCGWKHLYGDAYRNYAFLKSPTPGDVVTFGLDLTPHNAIAATLVSWSGASPSSDNLTATVPGTALLYSNTVTASACNCTTMPYTVWIFWGRISYNFSGDLDGDDALDFASPLGLTSIPGGSKVAGYAGGNATGSGGSVVVALNKVEIIGIIDPSGIGALVGNIFTFNYQTKSSAPRWLTFAPPVSSTSPYSTDSGGNDGGLPQQTTPKDDKIFALDSAGERDADTVRFYEGVAVNFKNNIYIGTVIASDETQWYSHIQTKFWVGVVTDITHHANAGSPTIPTTWGDPNW